MLKATGIIFLQRISITSMYQSSPWVINIQLPFACNAQIIKGFLPVTTDKGGKVLKFLTFQWIKKNHLLPGAATAETSLD